MIRLRTIAQQILVTFGIVILMTISALVSSVRADSAGISAPLSISDDAYLTGVFQLDRHLNGFDQPLVSTGSFTLSPKDGLVWENQEPFPDTTVMTDRGITRVLDDGSTEVIASGAQFHQFIALISAVLAGNWDALSAHFTIAEMPPETGENNASWHVKLVPLAGLPIADQIIEITASGDQFVEHVTIKKPSGDYDDITLGNQAKASLPLPGDIAILLSGQAQ
ncbi:hypothetical protein [Thalassospira profundimaris]|uniref:Outer membrane lipoprotein carrier protein LolA n=1 Tax=Thalassospira profundimaris TaxID=502049 RepID=A0A367WW89_9PROT|nr:hypothetical protein [Thalassospira profundimaris]RCK45723.1 hypothetical protein TH30_11280 [Thalassospira profundimaris]